LNLKVFSPVTTKKKLKDCKKVAKRFNLSEAAEVYEFQHCCHEWQALLKVGTCGKEHYLRSVDETTKFST